MVSYLEVIQNISTWATETWVVCPYDTVPQFVGKYIGAICSEDGSYIALINSNGIATGWTKCDTLAQCNPS